MINKPHHQRRKDHVYEIFNPFFRIGRITSGYTMQSLANTLGVSLALISQYEYCMVLPAPERQEQIAQLFSLPTERVFPPWLPFAIATSQELRHKRPYLSQEPFLHFSRKKLEQLTVLPENPELTSLVEQLYDTLQELTFEERAVLTMRYGIDQEHYTTEEIGKAFVRSSRWVATTLQRARTKLQYTPVGKRLLDYYRDVA